jgi:protein-disulfide isomerase
MPIKRPVLSLAASLAVLAGCSSGAAQQRTQLPGDVVATVGPRSITLAQVDERAMQQSTSSFAAMRLSQVIFEARRAVLDEMIGNELLDQESKARGVERHTLEESEINSKVGPVTDAEIAAWYQTNTARVQGATLDQVREPIRALLAQQRVTEARDRYLTTLKAKTPVRVLLEPPRQQVATAGRPTLGPSNAPIEMIEFSDFQCPYCQRANPTVTQVLNLYGDKIRFTYRHYPLPNHPNARPAAEAAQCANAQGKFWPFHDRLFANPSQLGTGDLTRHAAAVGLDTAQFEACVGERKYKADVDADIQAGNDAGVDGTPAFFINGRMLSGAQPFEVFKRVIDEELALKKAS